MKRNLAVAALIVLTLFLTKAQAELNSVAELSFRNRPQGINLLGTLRYDQLLWGEANASEPLYGFYRLGATLGGSPTTAAFLEVAPIAPISFTIQKGRTHRIFNSSVYNCENYECQGIIDRTDYKIKMAAGYENFVFLASFLWREIQTQETNRPVYLELENFAVTPGLDRYFERSLTFGIRLPKKRMAGFLENSGQISEGNQKYQSAYLFYQTPYHDFTLTGAVGHYRSLDADIEGLSAALAMTLVWGNRLSLW